MVASTPSTGARTLHYVYGVIEAGAHPTLDVPAVDERFAARVVEEGGLAAIVSEVPLAEFDEEALPESLGDPAWLGSKVRAHEAVLERVLAARAVVPFRFATVYVSEASIREMLRRDREKLVAALDRIGGKREWALKGFAYRDRLAEWLRAVRADLAEPEQPSGSGGEGSAYLARRQQDRIVEEEVDRALAAIARECHSQLVASAVETRLDPPSPTMARRDRGKLFLNGVYLVEHSREQEWHEAVKRLAQRFAEQGVSLEPTGPWPAYNFVQEEDR